MTRYTVPRYAMRFNILLGKYLLDHWTTNSFKFRIIILFYKFSGKLCKFLNFIFIDYWDEENRKDT